MRKQSYLHFSIGAASLLLIDLLLAMPAEATHFSCRASALRINELLGQVFEPVVANPADLPCVTEDKTLVSVTAPPPIVGVISAEALEAKTQHEPAHSGLPVTAEGKVAALSVLDLVTTGVLDAQAVVDSVGGKCVLSSSSSVAALKVLGVPVVVVSTYLKVTIPAVGILQLNATLGGPHPTSGPPNLNKVTQRALWLKITNPLLQTLTGLVDLITAEAIVDVDVAHGNPCS